MPVRKRRWSRSEDEIVLAAYPDYEGMQLALPHRTYFALRQRAGHLGAAKTREHWTAREMVKLAAKWPGSTKAELLEAFPGRAFESIKTAAKGLRLGGRGIVRRRCDPYREAINERARARGISNKGLDRMVGSGKYFLKAAGHFNPAFVFRAAELLEFDVAVEWEPLE